MTEDADLGMRLARFGYRTDVIDSTTFEEAPAVLIPWVRQRTRWFKGWMRPVKDYFYPLIFNTLGFQQPRRRLTIATLSQQAFCLAMRASLPRPSTVNS